MLDIKKVEINQTLSQKEQKKLFKKEIKKLHKLHKPEKHELSVNKHWAKEWKNFIKYDWDFDWMFLYDLILFKLEKMKAYLAIYNTSTDEWATRIDKEISDTIALGRKALDTDYREEAMKFSYEHTTPYVVVYDNETKKQITIVYSPVKDTEDSIFRDDYADQWCVDNNVDKKTVHYAYGSEWDDKANHKTWIKMLKEADKKQQKDFDAFFLSISRHMQGWWD